MQLADIPPKFPIPFANGAGVGFIRPIPVPSQSGITPGAASLTDGFPPLNLTPLGVGGVPPFGQDMNGLMNQVTAWVRWANAGGPVAFDAAFSGSVGGYPKGAIVSSAVTAGLFFYSLNDNNATNPDAAGAGWVSFSLVGGPPNYFVDSGTVNALVITPAPQVAAYVDGMAFRVYPSHINTGAATLAVDGLAAISIVNPDGSALIGGEIAVGAVMELTHVGSAFQWTNAPWTPTRGVGDNSNKLASTAYADRVGALVLTALDTYAGAIFGLRLSNTPSFLTTQVTVSAGSCRDSTNSLAINNTAPMSKDLTAPWAAGTGAGGKLTGTALAAGQTWHMFLLFNSTTSAVDFGFDQSPTAPTLPTGYTNFRRIGSVILDAAATTIRAFIHHDDDWFMLALRSTDYAVTANGGGVSFYRPITSPLGISTLVRMYFQSTGTANTNTFLSLIADPAFGAPPAFGPATQWAQVRRGAFLDSTSTAVSYGTTIVDQWTDTTSHVYTFSSDTSDVIALGVLGWHDQRGRFF